MARTAAQLRILVVSALVGGALVACALRRSPGGELDKVRVAFDVVVDVLQHPRCLNCHPAGEQPLQFDTSQPHAMNVVRGDDGRGMYGMRCAGCHTASNSRVAHLPPGVRTEWRMAPLAMTFEGQSRTELATMLVDEERSHMTRRQLLEHVEHDPLVLWGWDPGPGRNPVPVPHDEFVAAFRTWIEAGAPAPHNGN